MRKRTNGRRSAFHNQSMAFVRNSELGGNVGRRRAALSHQYRSATRPYSDRRTDRRNIPQRLRDWLGRARVNIRNSAQFAAARAQHANDRSAIERIRNTRVTHNTRLVNRGGRMVRVPAPHRIIGPPGYSHYPPLP